MTQPTTELNWTDKQAGLIPIFFIWYFITSNVVGVRPPGALNDISGTTGQAAKVQQHFEFSLGSTSQCHNQRSDSLQHRLCNSEHNAHDKQTNDTVKIARFELMRHVDTKAFC